MHYYVSKQDVANAMNLAMDESPAPATYSVNYTTTDAAANAQLTIYCEARPMDGGTLTAV